MLTVYSSIDCKNCDKAKRALTQIGVPFEVIEIDDNEEATNFMISEGHILMPQIYYKGRLFESKGYFGVFFLTKEKIYNRMKEMDEMRE